MEIEWFYGCVENRLDPKQLGRVQVRILGIHSELKVPDDLTGQGIPTEDLPWAMPMLPTTSAGMNGIGDSPTGIVEGSWVFGLSRDGKLYSDLMILGVVGGIPVDKPYDIGFQDPRTAQQIANSPRKVNLSDNRDPNYASEGIPSGRYPQEAFLNEPDTNRLARGIATDMVNDKIANTDKDVVVAITGETWSEPATKFAAKYPYNNVSESESGHVSEIDDTPDAERLHTFHKSGTFVEVHPDGSRVTNIVGDDFLIIQKGKNVHIKGNLNITVDGDANVKCSNARLEASDMVHIKTNAVQIDASDSYNVLTKNYKVTASVKAFFDTPMVEGSGEVKDKTRTMTGDRLIFNSHTQTVTGHSLATPPSSKM